jgi:hypothetical protein
MDFNTTSAKDCVNAALEMVKLFPNKPDLHFIYSKGPWWAVVHLSKYLPHIKYAVQVLFQPHSHSSNIYTSTRDDIRKQER